MPNNLDINTLVERFRIIKSNRCQWDTHWQECADFCLPQKAIITRTRSSGEKLSTEIYDSTALQGAQIFAAGLHSYLTNPSARWFALAMRNKKLMDVSDVRDWLKSCEEIIFDTINSSNFNQIIHEDYIDFGVFGNSTIYSEEDAEEDIVFSCRPINEIYFLANHRGNIDTVYRNFNYTVRQAYQRWKGNAGKKVLDLLNAGKVEDTLPFLHIVLPREERNASKKDARNMAFSSIYIEPETKKILSEGGYEEFPYFIGRCYKVSDSEYAYSPASLALADIKMLNRISKDILEAAEKTLFPPIVLPHDGYILPFKTSPKAINYRLEGNPEDKVETLQVNREINLSLEMENQRRQIINKAFAVDLFLMLSQLSDKQRTATEIMERVNERMLILGPMLGRLMHEKLDPIVIRTFNILNRLGKLPEPPFAIEGQEYKIEYISPLAKAQKATETRSLSEIVNAVKAMMEIDTTAVDNIDSDKIIKKFAEANYVADVLRSDDEIKAIRQQRQEIQQAQMQLEMLKTGGEGAKTVLEAEQILRENPNATAKK